MEKSKLTFKEFRKYAQEKLHFIVDELKEAEYAIPIDHAWESSYIVNLQDGLYVIPTHHEYGHGSFLDFDNEPRQLSDLSKIDLLILRHEANLEKLKSLKE
jgi:hypothetical protein